jgi:hypothetical protein
LDVEEEGEVDSGGDDALLILLLLYVDKDGAEDFVESVFFSAFLSAFLSVFFSGRDIFGSGRTGFSSNSSFSALRCE